MQVMTFLHFCILSCHSFDFVFAFKQATTPWTLLEAGFNFNHTKDLLRLLRDRGALAGGCQNPDAMSDKEKPDQTRTIL